MQQVSFPEARLRPIGLIGGLGVGATVQIYEAFISACRAENFSPPLMIAHADVGRVLTFASSNQKAELAAYLASIIKKLALAGAEVAAIPAITPHICMPELLSLSPITLLNMLALTAGEIHRQSLSRVALFGTRTTIESRFFHALGNVDVVLPHSDEVSLIHETYVSLVKDGYGTHEQATLLRDLAHLLIERDGVNAIVLAGTELALLFNDRNIDFPAIDCSKLLVAAMVKAVRSQGGSSAT